MDLGELELAERRAAPIVTLEWYEVQAALGVGGSRQIEAMRRGKPDVDGMSPTDGWFNHINGACGEQAVAKYLGRFWSGSVNTFRVGGDVGADIEVRTRSECWYELKITDKDPRGAIFILVLGYAPVFHIRGWCYPADVDDYLKSRPKERARWFKDPGERGSPQIFAPQSALRPPEELFDERCLKRGLREPQSDGTYRMGARSNGCKTCRLLHAEVEAKNAAAWAKRS